jgi:hypothetical protein
LTVVPDDSVAVKPNVDLYWSRSTVTDCPKTLAHRKPIDIQGIAATIARATTRAPI